jgi:photosystem II stability/assembly factor-like uncharacterized protein
VGASLYPPGNGDPTSIFYRSDNYGATWQSIEPQETISSVGEIDYDAFNPNLIYAAANGLWRSLDGGNNWSHVPIANMQPPVGVSAIATHPNIPNRIYLRAYSYADTPNPESELWVSDDAGNSWQERTDISFGADLVVSPPLPGQLGYKLYTGCEFGLCRSTDGGITWSSIADVPRPGIVETASDGSRSIIYMGTTGGLVDSGGGLAGILYSSIPGRGSVFGGGVYRLTNLLPTDWLYLPIIMR